MKIGVVTLGRFHVLDLARELDCLGHDVLLYSALPTARARKFGLPRQCHQSLFLFLSPLLAAQRLAPRWMSGFIDRALIRTLDFIAAVKLKPCDVFIGMSGLCVESARVARERFGAVVVIERSSRHIISQKEILESLAEKVELPSEFSIRRELWAYKYADLIDVPSTHARESFLKQGVPREKVFVSPFGVDLNMFSPTARRKGSKPTVIFVGLWCLRKGCDLLWRACDNAKAWQLLHVGPIGDCELPSSPLFRHVGPVAQADLPECYAQADVSALCSREDGFGLVLVQALACGLPVVCSDRTGGEDLRQLLTDKKWIFCVPAEDLASISTAVTAALQLSLTQKGARDFLKEDRQKFSWREHGKRYSDEISRRVAEKKKFSSSEMRTDMQKDRCVL